MIKMPRYRVNIKRQGKDSKSTIGTTLTVEAETEFQARLAAEGIAKSRWPDYIIMICEVKKQ